jgi:antagonist of KipI
LSGFLRVKTPGFFTTVQDLGRYGHAHQGISASGAADAVSARVANRLVGNPENAAVLEMTLVGGAFEFSRESVVALTGSDFGANVPAWEAAEIPPNGLVQCGPTREGARAYLAVRGGIEVPLVLGSASTHVLTGIGGFEGRPLKRGDVLPIGDRVASPPLREKAALEVTRRAAIRVTPGPQADWFPEGLGDARFEVAEESNRMGLRLRGPRLRAAVQRQLLTEGVALGAVQVPSEGDPIILFVEHQTTGGYPKIASVISADLCRVGQLRPRDAFRFESVSFEQARVLLEEQERAIRSLA